MNIDIKTINFNPKPSLVEFVKVKVGKLQHFHNKIESAAVFLKLEKADDDRNKVCEIKLAIAGKDLFASHQSMSFEESANKTLDALKVQIEHAK